MRQLNVSSIWRLHDWKALSLFSEQHKVCAGSVSSVNVHTAAVNSSETVTGILHIWPLVENRGRHVEWAHPLKTNFQFCTVSVWVLATCSSDFVHIFFLQLPKWTKSVATVEYKKILSYKLKHLYKRKVTKHISGTFQWAGACQTSWDTFSLQLFFGLFWSVGFRNWLDLFFPPCLLKCPFKKTSERFLEDIKTINNEEGRFLSHSFASWRAV